MTDKQWTFAVLERDKYICRLCGSANAVQAHHIIKRVYKKTRTMIENGITLCYDCHYDVHHRKPKEYKEKIIACIGIESYNKLREISIND